MSGFRCPKCGNLCDTDSKFCNKCGIKFEILPCACRGCGMINDPGATVCERCGLELDNNPNISPVSPQIQQPNVTIQPQSNLVFWEHLQEQRKKRQRNIIILVVVLFVISFLAFIYSDDDITVPSYSVSSASGSSGGSTPSKQPSGDITKEPSGKFDAQVVISQLEITTYQYRSLYDYVVLVVKNPTNFDIDITARGYFYDENGNIVDTSSDSEAMLASGAECIIRLTCDTEYYNGQYDLEVKKSRYKFSHDFVTLEAVRAPKKEIVSVTNNSKYDLDFIKVEALFFNGGELVDYDYSFFGKDLIALKSGEKDIKEITCYETYDEVEYYITGRY